MLPVQHRGSFFFLWEKVTSEEVVKEAREGLKREKAFFSEERETIPPGVSLHAWGYQDKRSVCERRELLAMQ
jgi:hypothetical protein